MLINTNRLGSLAEAKATEYFASLGFIVYLPLGTAPDIDLVVKDNEKLHGIQCKWSSNGKVDLRTTTQWAGKVRKRKTAKFDWLWISTIEGDNYLIPSNCIKEQFGLQVSTYSKFKVLR